MKYKNPTSVISLLKNKTTPADKMQYSKLAIIIGKRNFLVAFAFKK